MALFIFLILVGYLMGSINSAIIVCRTFGLPDPREEGSKNPGATNVLRLGGKQYGILVMVCDALKGILPVIIAQYLSGEPVTIAFTALAAVVGHMYPVFFHFRGGKGVATTIGALLAFHFVIGVMVGATWLLVANFWRYSSLASIISITLAPFYSLILVGNLNIFPPLFMITILVLYKHRDNFNRLIDGKEPKIKFKHSVIEEIMDASPATSVEQEFPGKEVIDTHIEETIKTEQAEAVKKPKAKKTTTKTKKTSSTEETAKKPKSTKPRTKTVKEKE
ncbi:glycerol-3-phosphate 1-O-acyltransferase PlsY [Legionella pneumophila]|uniref:Glycerol-3-phosphate acyltransferase n=1 Tax=Legionella pneumophila subsp. pascullei TaxID=91890 RepID=A0AAX2J1B6_LEGPN|nr:glycerol-3-phosphate 1-O-acyltransferase PlsY [Legionella pneumophila]AMP89090.1 acyl-phosphate glycerol 3-phosphate acyltransferase [Legionella pneumophila subsp. pascullei]AMP93243.1 glycerol-3-phosphate acyltransferase [Legionella pneumophila subsp. pascullei]AMP96209.1 glycerol-3-phosphate acyltransferase [Legionella pneumophila subsp. pascullei]SQG91159.1 transmembrane protein [Legionella pneumophila subsp. pascullei]VEH07705.1 transmembrane protein [Legionella pneumophila subsp. pascu